MHRQKTFFDTDYFLQSFKANSIIIDEYSLNELEIADFPYLALYYFAINNNQGEALKSAAIEILKARENPEYAEHRLGNMHLLGKSEVLKRRGKYLLLLNLETSRLN